MVKGKWLVDIIVNSAGGLSGQWLSKEFEHIEDVNKLKYCLKVEIVEFKFR